MLIYLDLCCFNRPFDDQAQSRIRLETEAKVAIQQHLRDGQHQLVWSHILDFENSLNPFGDRRDSVSQWRPLAVRRISHDEQLVALARQLSQLGLTEYDALHVAAAITGKVDLFVSTDDRLVKKLKGRDDIRCLLPGDALALMEDWYED